MTRKDYILVAKALRTPMNSMSKPTYERELSGIRMAVISITDALAADNPRFDRDHFLAVVRSTKDLNSRPGRQS